MKDSNTRPHGRQTREIFMSTGSHETLPLHQIRQETRDHRKMGGKLLRMWKKTPLWPSPHRRCGRSAAGCVGGWTAIVSAERVTRVAISHRRDCVTKPHVALKRNPGILQTSLYGNADSATDRLLSNRFRPHSIRRKHQPIRNNRQRTQFTKNGFEVRSLRENKSKEIEISCRAVAGICPHPEEHRSFQQEMLRIVGLAETIKEPLNTVASQNQIERFLALLAQDKKPLAN